MQVSVHITLVEVIGSNNIAGYYKPGAKYKTQTVKIEVHDRALLPDIIANTDVKRLIDWYGSTIHNFDIRVVRELSIKCRHCEEKFMTKGMYLMHLNKVEQEIRRLIDA